MGLTPVRPLSLSREYTETNIEALVTIKILPERNVLLVLRKLGIGKTWDATWENE